MQNIILFGQMGSGKSIIARYLGQNYDYAILSLGAKIHSECKLHGNETREEMQNYGQMMRKIFGENTWCDYLYLRSKNYKKIVIDDARQLNEFEFFAGKGYLSIGVIATNDARLKRLQKRVNYTINPESFNHETEQQAKECVKKSDIKIYNNSSVEDLFREIEIKLGEYLIGGKDE